MSGNYPDVPGPRMAWDRDGSILLTINNNGININSHADAITLNDELSNDGVDYSGNQGVGQQVGVVVFPELRDLAGFYIAAYNYGNWSYQTQHLETSTDTTNGTDGTWILYYDRGNSDRQGVNYRTQIKSQVALGVKAVRFSTIDGGAPYQVGVYALHLYGKISDGQSLNRLAIWHPTLDQEVGGAYFDWGNAPQSSVATRQFRVKNLSTTQTANAVVCSRDVLTDTNPTVLAQQELSSDNATFASTANAGTLAPGALSSVMTLRRSIQANAVLGLWAARMNVAATSWV